MKPLALALTLFAASVFAQAMPRAQTLPIPTPTGAKDTAIWVHPTDRSRSLVFGTDQFGSAGLLAYGLDGRFHYGMPLGNTVAVDVRYGVPVGSAATDVVLTVTATGNFLLFSPDRDAGELSPLDVNALTGTATGTNANAAALYFSPRTGVLAVFVADTSGNLRHYRAASTAAGLLTLTLVRTIALGVPVQGIAADDRGERLFLTLANKGLYVLPAEASGSLTPALVESIDAGRLAGAEGVALYFTADGGGYVIASANLSSRFPVYALANGFPFVASFSVVANADAGIRGATNTRGIEVMPLSLGAPYDQGLFVAQDQLDTNYKLIPWERISSATAPTLAIDTRLDPRNWMTAAADAGKSDAGTKCTVPMVPDSGVGDGGKADAGPFDAGDCPGGSGGGGGSSGVGGGLPSATGGGNVEEPKGCGCNQAGLLVPLAALAWLLRRRRAQ